MKFLIDTRPENQLIPASSQPLLLKSLVDQWEIWQWPILKVSAVSERKWPMEKGHLRKDSDLFPVLEQADGIIAISTNAIYAANMYLSNAWPKLPIYAAVGPTTQALWRELGVDAVAPSQGTGADALLDREELMHVAKQSWVILRAQQGSTALIEELENRNAVVIPITVYQRLALTWPHQYLQKLQKILETASVAILITSRETLEHLLRQLPLPLLKRCTIWSTHFTIAEAAKKAGLQTIIVDLSHPLS